MWEVHQGSFCYSVCYWGRSPWPKIAISDEGLVRSLDDQERVAALNRDGSALERLWSDQFILNAPNNQVVVGKRAVLDTFVRAGIYQFLDVRAPDRAYLR